MPTLSLSPALTRKIEQLAQQAGRTPQEMREYVLRDGFEYCEYAVGAVDEGLADTEGADIDEVEAWLLARRARRDGVHPAVDQFWDEAWDRLAARRDAEIEAGTATPVPGPEAVAQLRAELL